MRPLRIALGDLSYLHAPVSSAESKWQSDLYVPLNIGYLASYAKKRFGRDIDIRLFKDPVKMLSHIRDERPDLIGLSAYYWNAELGKFMVRKARGISGYSPTVVLGGPSVDSDPTEQMLYHGRNPGVDFVIPNEGEMGFAAIVERLVGGRECQISTITGLSTDLAEVPSPYLDGTLDEFLDGPYQPMIQTSRSCPFTCSFCVSGKNRGKLRAFDVGQVAEELSYIGKRFAGRPELVLHITDENFGILERDVAVAEYVREAKQNFGYPAKVFYYNDKRFTKISRTLQETLGDICHHGVTLSLQSENPETLKAIKRRNLTDEQITSAIDWAHGLGLRTTTELIFGLPMETRASFMALLDKCAKLGFDSVQCYTLIMFDGIEMNREAYRKEHGLKTKRRLISGGSQWVDGELVVESEELVVSSNTFSFDDYRFIRLVGTWFHAIFVDGMHKEFFQGLAAKGESISRLLERLSEPTDGGDSASKAHRDFLSEFNAAVTRKLYEPEELAAMVRDCKIGNSSMPDKIKLQPHFAARLVANQDGWVAKMIARVSEMEMAA